VEQRPAGASEQPDSPPALPWDRRTPLVWGLRIAFGLLLLGTWELASGRWVRPFWVSKPSMIAARLIDLAASGELFLHTRVTVEETLLGLLAGMLRVPAGILFARVRFLEAVVSPFVMALYSLPRVALAPLFILWFGIGLLSKVVLVFSMVFFVAFYNTYQGVKNVDPDLVDCLRAMKATDRQIVRYVVFPSIATWILTSLRMNIAMSLIGAVLSEMVASNRGLGYYIQFSSGNFDTTGVFTGLAVVIAVAMVLESLTNALERRVLRIP
jgi:NitT/TauT family transport system permease protein